MTRATLRLLHGDVPGSLWLHPVALPGAVGLAVAVVSRSRCPTGTPRGSASSGVGTLLAAALNGRVALRSLHLAARCSRYLDAKPLSFLCSPSR